MSRIARWRKGPDDLATVQGWLTASSTPSLPDLRDKGQARPRFKLAVIILIGGFLLSSVRLWVPMSPWWQFVLSMPPAIALALSLAASANSPQREPRQEDAGGYEVSVVVRDAHGGDTGRDHGFLIFCDGWLLFEGQRTSFAVTRGEAVPRKDRTELYVRFEDKRSAAFSCLFPDQREEIFAEFDRWSQSPPPDGEAILPPVETHLTVLTERWAYMIVLAVIGAIALFGALLSGTLWLAVAGALLVFGGLGASRPHLHAIQKAFTQLLPVQGPSPLPPLDRDALGSRPPATTSTLPG